MSTKLKMERRNYFFVCLNLYLKIKLSTASLLNKTQGNFICLFRVLCLHLYGEVTRQEQETNKLFNLFLRKKYEIEPASFQGVGMYGIPTVE